MGFDWLESRRKKHEAEQKRKEDAEKTAKGSREAVMQKRLRAKRGLDDLVMRVLHNLGKAAYPKCEVKNQDLDLPASHMVGEWSIGSSNKEGIWESQVSVFAVFNETNAPQYFKCFLLDHEEDSIGLHEKDLIEALNALHDHFSDKLFKT